MLTRREVHKKIAQVSEKTWADVPEGRRATVPSPRCWSGEHRGLGLGPHSPSRENRWHLVRKVVPLQWRGRAGAPAEHLRSQGEQLLDEQS
jgi:hypothetical protein